MTEDKMVGWHHRLNAHEFEQGLGDGEGQGSQVCCSPWGHKELDMTKLAMAPHSSTLAWKIPWAEEPGRLQSMGSLRVGRTRLSDFTFTFHYHALEKEMATHSCSCLENPRDGGAWWAAIYGVAESDTTEVT